jgi:hypothetical protein
MSQPKWKLVYATDYSAVFEDETGVYPPEMEIASEYEDRRERTRFMLHRFPLDPLKKVKRDGKTYIVSWRWAPEWPHPIKDYEDWFIKDLGDVARSIGSTKEELINALTSEDPKELAWAYEAIGGYHGLDNLDSHPLDLSEKNLEERIEKHWR